MDMRRLCRGDHFLVSGVGPPILDVVINRVVEQHCILRHDADGATQSGLFQITDVDAVNGDAAPTNIVEAIQQARQR